MFEHLIHVNSKGESLDFYELGIFQNYNDLRDYEWEYSEVGNRIKNFRKKPVQKTVPYIFIVDEEKAVEIVNKFHEHFDIDIVRKTKGYFKIGEWRLYCYCEGMNFDDYLKLNGYLKITCKYISDEPNWRKEQKASFKPQEQGDYDFLDFYSPKAGTKVYGGDYPFDFTGRTAGRASFVVDHFADCDFKMTIYGPAIYPRVLIEDTVYQVYTTLATNEYLVVDSKNKQVYKYSVNGYRTNCFDLRNKTNSIFTKISGGSHSAIWDGSFGFEISFYIERSTPTWNLF